MMLAAEALIAVTGLFPERPLTAKDGREAEKLPKIWTAEIRDFLDGRPVRFRAPPAVNYRKTLDRLAAGIDVEEAADLTQNLASDDVAREYKVALSNAREYLRAQWPKLQLMEPTGPEILEPGEIELGRLSTLYATVNDPGRVLAEMRSRSLTKAQVDALAGAFPGLYEMLKAIVADQIQRRTVEARSYRVPWDQKVVLNKVWQFPQNVPLSQIQQEPPKSAPVPQVKIDFERQRTKAETIEARETTQ